MFALTPRLTLRPWWPEDTDALTTAIAHRDVAMRLARLPWPYARDDAEAFLAVPRTPHEPNTAILSRDGREPRLLGGIGLHRGAHGVHELGYWLTPDAWGKGYATEAARAMLHAARHALGIRRVEASYHVANPASGRVLAKLGFREVRREPHFSLANGGMVDCVVTARDLAAEVADDSDDARAMKVAA